MLQGGSSSEIVYPIAGHYHIRGISPNEGRRMARALGKNVPDNPGIELGEGVRVEEDLVNIPNDFETRRGVLFCSPQFGDTPEEESFAFYRDIKKVRQSWMTTAGYTIARNGNIIFLDMVTYSSPNYSDSKPGVIRAEIEDKGTHFEVAKISRW